MNQTILEEIKKAEQEAENISLNAEKKSLEIIDDAKHTSVKVLGMREREIQHAREMSIAAGREKIRTAKEKLIENRKLELKELEKKAEKMKEKAIEAVIAYFEEELK